MDLQNRVVFVTGAAGGIGRGCALVAAQSGADVVINDREESDAGSAVCEEIRALGRQCELVAGDVFDREASEGIVERAEGVFGRIDAFISNPACSRRGAFLEFGDDDAEQVIAGTLTSGFRMAQRVARGMVARERGGSIVFISSVQGRLPFAGCSAYSAAKAGLTHLARNIALELLPHRIRVNVIEPGWIDTPGEHRTFGSDVLAESGAQLPWGRLGSGEEIGGVAAFLCSPAADYITGASLLVDGGLSLVGGINVEPASPSENPTA